MKFFLDTANMDEIREAHSWGIISGVTTNPSLIAKEGRDFKQVIQEIEKLVGGPTNAEVIALDHAGMMKEAYEYVKWGKNIIVKVPMTPDGLKTVAKCKAEGIKTNVTLIFSVNQALMAAVAGASYVSPFVGRLDDISTDGIELIRDMAEVFANYPELDTEILAASIRHPLHVIECARAGADICTMPMSVLKQMVAHPLTDRGIERFLKDWEKAKAAAAAAPAPAPAKAPNGKAGGKRAHS